VTVKQQTKNRNYMNTNHANSIANSSTVGHATIEPSSPAIPHPESLHDSTIPPSGVVPTREEPAPDQSRSAPAPLRFPVVEPWPEPVDGKTLLDLLAQIFARFVILPKWAAETLALWTLHTYAFQLREVSTYLGIESPLKRCGKTTLLELLSELAHRAVASANISPPAFFRVIEEFCPTLLIDEADTFLPGNEQLKGILNSGYKRKNAFVLRAANQYPASSIQHPSSPSHQSDNPTIHDSAFGAVLRFSCWCPKAISTIGRLPDVLADRCIIIRMQRKTIEEQCEPSRNLDAEPFRRQCKRFVLDHAPRIAAAQPQRPELLNDRAADIWEPLFALADLAGGDWPQKARQAAIGLSAATQEINPISTLLLDLFVIFTLAPENRLFTRDLVYRLNARSADRPWAESLHGKPVTDLWLAKQLRPYGIKSRTIWIGDEHAKGFLEEDLQDTMRRYVSRSDLDALKAEWAAQRRPVLHSAPDEGRPKTKNREPNVEKAAEPRTS
jgi:hypothetical protein